MRAQTTQSATRHEARISRVRVKKSLVVRATSPIGTARMNHASSDGEGLAFRWRGSLLIRDCAFDQTL